MRSLKHRIVASCAAVLAMACPALGQTSRPKAEEVPWAVRLGLRVQQVDAVFPLVDRVVLVPDAATYVDELAKWSPAGRWPVLIEDDTFTPLFVRRFAPAQLIRRPPVGRALPENAAAMQGLLEKVVTHAFSGRAETVELHALFTQMKFVPPGVVIASVKDPAWTAAVALAAGRGQPLLWMDESFGTTNGELDDAQAHALMAAVASRVRDCGWTSGAMGDEIQTITMCRAIAGRAQVKLPPIAQVNADAGPLAVTDLLGRDEQGRRYAFAGWIFGDQARSAYMAMCALFLNRENITLFNTYPAASDWAVYGTAEAAGILRQRGYKVTDLSGKDTTEAAWARLLIGGLNADVFIMNSKGNSDFFDMSAGRCYFPDVPVLNEPVALHLIHSWSMQEPGNPGTVGGRWLDHGAYFAVGSCWEPFLGAFMTPKSLAQRIVSFVPFALAARYWENEGMFSRPWRINTIGDPLMLCAPPEQARHKRITLPGEYGTELNQQVKTLMRQASTEGGAEAFRDAMRILDMLGRDEVAVQFWQLAQSKGQGKVVARAALGPLFRTHNVDEFMKAWDLLPGRDALAADMLWHLLQTRIGPGADKDLLLQLQGAIRQPYPQVDLERLAPSLFKTFGKAHTRDVIEREIKKTDNGNVKAALAAIENKY